MTTVAERIYKSLKADIISGRYEPGEHLREAEIADDMKTSRTPLREALRRLMAEQWVTQVPNYGVKVTDWRGSEDMEVFFSLRVLIESYIAERAATMATADDIKKLTEIQEKYRTLVEGEGADPEALQEQNLLFHQALLDSTRSVWLSKMARTLVTLPVLLATYKSYDKAQLGRSVKQHDELLEAIRTRSVELAGAVMKTHIIGAKVSFLQKQLG